MKYKIGIYGSSVGDMGVIMPKAMELSRVLGEHADQVIIITGAGAGLPYEVASQTAAKGVEVWGFPSAKNFDGLKRQHPDHDFSIYKKLVYVPADFEFIDNDRTSMKYRNVTSTATADAGIIISGAWGTLNEYAVLTDQGKVAAVLADTGGIADELPSLLKKITKKGQGETFFEADPKRLVEQLLTRLGTTN
jgi:predicted Rossmann-fold nucleotide-binding protein